MFAILHLPRAIGFITLIKAISSIAFIAVLPLLKIPWTHVLKIVSLLHGHWELKLKNDYIKKWLKKQLDLLSVLCYRLKNSSILINRNENRNENFSISLVK